MTNEKTENKYMQQQGVTKDVTAKDVSEQMIKSIRSDIEAYENSLEKIKKDKANYEEQLEVDKQIWDILEQEGSVKKLNPAYVFEQHPDWTKLQQKKQAFQIRMDRAVADGQLKSFEHALEDSERKLAESKELLKEALAQQNE